jgi:hypothetical protein
MLHSEKEYRLNVGFCDPMIIGALSMRGWQSSLTSAFGGKRKQQAMLKHVIVGGILWALACIPVVAEPTFKVKGSVFGNLEFSGAPQRIELEFQNNGSFSGPVDEVIRLTDAWGHGAAPALVTVEMTPELKREHVITIPASWDGPFQLRYSLLAQGQLLFSREIRGANYTPVTWQDPDHSLLGCYVWGIRWHGERLLPVMKNIGVPWIRTIVNWGYMEPEEGKMSFASMDKNIALLDQLGFRVLVNYERSPSWASRLFEVKDGWQLFADRAEELARRYPSVRVWEVWNEPDFKQNIFGDDTGKGVAEMLKAFYPAVKRGNPKALVAACGTAANPKRVRTFLDSLFQNGGGGYFDIYTYHYTVAREANLEKLREHNWSGPVWNTEDSPGYFSKESFAGERSLSFVRNTLASAARGVERNFYFLCYIPTKTLSAREEFDHSRLFDNDFLPTSNLWMLRTMAEQLNGYRFAKELSLGEGSQGVLMQHAASGEFRSVIWRQTDAPRALLLATSEPLATVGVFGDKQEFSPVGGYCSVPLSMPIYLHGEIQVAMGRPMLVFRPPATGFLLGEKQPVTIVLHNPSAQELTGSLAVTVPCDWKPLASVPVKLGAGESSDITVLLEPGDLPDETSYVISAKLLVNGKMAATDQLAGRLLPSLAGELTAGFREGKKRVVLHLRNQGSAAIRGSARLLGDNGVERPFMVAAGRAISVEFAPALAGESGKVAVELTAGKLIRVWEKELEWHQLPACGQTLEPLVLATRDHFKSSSPIIWRWEGPQDLSSRSTLCWSPEGIRFRAEVTDDLHYHPSAEPSPQEDSLQFFLDGQMYIAALTPQGARLRADSAMVSPGFVSTVERQGSVTVYELLLPKPGGGAWQANDRVRFAFLVNDADANQDHEGWLFSPPVNIGDPLERKQVPELILAAAAFVAPEATVAPETIPATLNPARWQPNAATKDKTVFYDTKEGALVFRGVFAPDCKDRWFYPIYTLSEEERACRYLTFQVKAVQAPMQSGYSNVQFWFKGGVPCAGNFIYRHIDDSYRTHTLDLHARQPGPLLPEKLYFGLCNRNDDEVTLYIKELRFHNDKQ